MRKIETNFKDLKIIKLKKYSDNRGYLKETFRKNKIQNKNLPFTYYVNSRKNIIRGFHFQYKFQQIKYITVLKGRILDCVIDLRKKSKTFGKVYKIILSEKNSLSFYIPAGFAHAYLTLDKENIVLYNLSNYYRPKFESGIIWNDNNLNINWPVKKPLLSLKDKKLPTFQSFLNKFKYL